MRNDSRCRFCTAVLTNRISEIVSRTETPLRTLAYRHWRSEQNSDATTAGRLKGDSQQKIPQHENGDIYKRNFLYQFSYFIQHSLDSFTSLRNFAAFT